MFHFSSKNYIWDIRLHFLSYFFDRSWNSLTVQGWRSWNSFCRPRWPWRHRDLPDSFSCVLGLKVYSTTPNWCGASEYVYMSLVITPDSTIPMFVCLLNFFSLLFDWKLDNNLMGRSNGGTKSYADINLLRNFNICSILGSEYLQITISLSVSLKDCVGILVVNALNL